MATLPDAASIDWVNIGAWAAGATTVVVSMGAAAWLAIRRAVQIAQTQPAPSTTTKEETNIITADSVAMEQLAATIEASNLILTENNILRREEHNDRTANRSSLEANTEAMERVLAAINEARTEIRELTREIVRSNR